MSTPGLKIQITPALVLEDQDTWELGPLGPMPSISAATSEGNAVARPGATVPRADFTQRRCAARPLLWLLNNDTPASRCQQIIRGWREPQAAQHEGHTNRCCEEIDCPGRQPPFLTVKHLARPYRITIQKPIYCGKC